MPIVSVILSVYNAAPYLEEAVSSVLKQTFTDFEFLIYEDKSTDNSLEILRKFKEQDSRIYLIERQENKGFEGYIANLNEGLKLAKGKYIAIMDNDDICFIDRFQKQVEFLENNEAIFLVGASQEIIEDNGTFIKIKNLLTDEITLKTLLPKSNYLAHPTIMFRNDGKVFYRDKLRKCNDYDLYLRLLTAGKRIVNLPDILLKYRISTNSQSRTGGVENLLFKMQTILFYHQRIKNGVDEYEKFNVDEVFKITEKNVYTNPDLLKMAIQIFYKMKDMNAVLKLIIKLRQ